MITARPGHGGAITRALLAVLAAAVALAATPAAAPAATTCPAELRALRLATPSYGRAGEGVPVRVQAERPEAIAGAVLTVTSAASTDQYPLTLAAGWTTVVVPAGPPYADWTAVLRWTQDAGSLAACSGKIRAELPIIPQLGSAGDPLIPRLEGRFRVTIRQVRPTRRKPYRETWKFKPRCDHFGCDTRWRPSPWRFKGVLESHRGGRYLLYRRSGPTWGCTGNVINTLTGEVIKPYHVRRAYWLHTYVSIKATKTGAAGVKAISGRIRFRYEPTPRGRRKGCYRNWTYTETFRGQLR